MSSGRGFFGGLFNYSKPGPGVRKDEKKPNRFMFFWVLVKRKFWKLIQLNLLYLVCCIPIITIGPATAAMTYILRLYANEQPVFLFSDFKDAFVANWKQSFVYSLLAAALTIIVTIAVQFYWMNSSEHVWMYLLLGLSIMLMVIATMAHFYIYLMIVTLELKLRYIIKNGVLLAILRLKTNAITFVVTLALLVVSFLFFPLSLFVWVFIGFSFLNFVFVYNSFPGIQKHAIDPFLAQQEELQQLDAPLVTVDADGNSIFIDEYDKPEDAEDNADVFGDRYGVTDADDDKYAN